MNRTGYMFSRAGRNGYLWQWEAGLIQDMLCLWICLAHARQIDGLLAKLVDCSVQDHFSRSSNHSLLLPSRRLITTSSLITAGRESRWSSTAIPRHHSHHQGEAVKRRSKNTSAQSLAKRWYT
jgi:hypothetical protein